MRVPFRVPDAPALARSKRDPLARGKLGVAEPTPSFFLDDLRDAHPSLLDDHVVEDAQVEPRVGRHQALAQRALPAAPAADENQRSVRGPGSTLHSGFVVVGCRVVASGAAEENGSATNRRGRRRRHAVGRGNRPTTRRRGGEHVGRFFVLVPRGPCRVLAARE